MKKVYVTYDRQQDFFEWMDEYVGVYGLLWDGPYVASFPLPHDPMYTALRIDRSSIGGEYVEVFTKEHATTIKMRWS